METIESVRGASSFVREEVPIEVYKVKGRDVHVYRGDLHGDGVMLPPWAKLGPIFNLLKNYADPHIPLTHMAVDGSWSGWTLAAFCHELNIPFYYSYPDSKKFNRQLLADVVEKYPNTMLNPVKPNMLAIMYNSLKSQVKQNGWQMLPYAFDHPYFINYVADQARKLNHFDNLVTSSGSGVMLSGLTLGFMEDDLVDFFNPNPKKKVWTTCVSSSDTIDKMLKKNGVHLPINIRKSEYDFSNRMDGYEAPFPCNQFWDIKQWHWLENNIDSIEGDILFWNLGGIYNF